MPRYDYRCSACQTVFEVARAIDDASPQLCPTCEAPAKRVFSPVGVVFKGSGFHNTDYRPRPKDGDGGGSDRSGSAGSCPSATGTGPCASCPASDA